MRSCGSAGVGFAVKPSAVNGVSQFFAESVARIKHRIISQVDCESSQSLAGDNSRIDMAATESAGSASLSPFQGGHCSGFAKQPTNYETHLGMKKGGKGREKK